MRRRFVVALALLLGASHVAFPARSGTFRSNTPPFSIDHPDGWNVRGEGGIATRAVGRGSAMNVSVTAASRAGAPGGGEQP